MGCELCGSPCQGRYCSACESMQRLEDMATELTAKYDDGKTEDDST